MDDSHHRHDLYILQSQLAAEVGLQPKRSSAAPDIPTVAETVPGFEATTWFALFAPANTPKPIIDRLNAEVQRVYRLPDVQERMQKLGLEAVLSSPEELARYQQLEIVKWAKVVKESGAKAE